MVYRGTTTGRLASHETYFDDGKDVGAATVPKPPAPEMMAALDDA